MSRAYPPVEILTLDLLIGHTVPSLKSAALEINLYMHVVTTREDAKKVTDKILSDQVRTSTLLCFSTTTTKSHSS